MVQDIKAVGPIGPKLRGPLVKLGSNEFKENDQGSSFTQGESHIMVDRI